MYRTHRQLLYAGWLMAVAARNPLGWGTLFRAVVFHYGITAALTAMAGMAKDPRVYGKRADGSFPVWSYALWWPWIVHSLFFTAAFVLGQWAAQGLPWVSELIDGKLYMGAFPVPGVVPRNACVLDVTAELPRLASPTASGKDTYLCVPALDGQAPTPEQLEAAAAWVCAKWSEGEKVLVHCAFGIGRSATVACAALVYSGRFGDWQSALAFVKDKRPVVRLNAAYMAALDKWEAVYVRGQRARGSSGATPLILPSGVAASTLRSGSVSSRGGGAVDEVLLLHGSPSKKRLSSIQEYGADSG